ncbi:MAG: hypothetical protein CMN72_07615 [Sphingomonas sp.]|nr:hypothetical protein [Sphingomonas sp.]
MVKGLAKDFQKAATALRSPSRRHEAMKTLDDARRLGRVMRDELGPAGEAAYKFVESARHAVQTGRPDEAARILETGAGRLTTLPFPNRFDSVDRTNVGTRVIDAEGRKLGRISAIDAAAGKATLKIGGVVDLFGFLDAGNRTVTVSNSDLAAGKMYAAYLGSESSLPR